MPRQERVKRPEPGRSRSAGPPARRASATSVREGEPLTAERVIQLQRSHGNQFVLELLHPPAAWSLQRDPTALERNTTAAERGQLQVARGGVPAFSKKELEDAFKDNPSHWADDVKFGSGIEATLQGGLQNLAQSVFHQEKMAENTVSSVPLDLTPFGGVNGVYRFTVLKRATAPRTRLIVELVSRQPPAELSQQGLEAEKRRFQKFEFKLGTDFEGEEAQKELYSALSRVPDSVLEHVRGLTFSRKLRQAGDRGEPGHYDPNTHTIEVYGGALTKYANSADAGGADWLTFVVTHEIGHAADSESYTVARRKRDALAAQLKEAQLDARRVDTSGGIGRDDDAAQRAKEEKVRQLQRQLNAAQAAFDAVVVQARSQSRAYRNARGKAISEYGATSDVENFAEDFALFVLDPDLLKSLRPQAHAYFAREFR